MHVLAPLASPDAGNPRVVKDPLRYKTQICANFQRDGVCRYGRRCQFAHGAHELRDRHRFGPPDVQSQFGLRPNTSCRHCRKNCGW